MTCGKVCFVLNLAGLVQHYDESTVRDLASQQLEDLITRKVGDTSCREIFDCEKKLPEDYLIAIRVLQARRASDNPGNVVSENCKQYLSGLRHLREKSTDFKQCFV